MTEHPIGRAVRHVARAVGEPAAVESDRELLDRWAAVRDHAAFELLVWRYGGLVLAACRRVLPAADAEDAFQATFLVLAKKAGAVGRRGTLGGWLHRVAVRVARAANAQVRRQPGPLGFDPVARATADADADLRRLLDEELDRLPDRFRQVLVLCYLHGKTADEAARELGCPRGTVLSRLMRARDRLRGRLERRGVALSAAALLAGLEQAATGAAVTGRLVNTAVGFGVGAVAGGPAMVAVPGPVAGLVQGVLRAMWMKTVKTAAAGVLLAGGLGVGVGLTWQHAGAQSAPIGAPQPPAPGVRSPAAKPDAKKDLEKLLGKWKVVALTMGDDEVPEATAQLLAIEFGEKKVTFTGRLAKGGAQYIVRPGSDDYPFTLDPTKKVAEIDIAIKENEPAKGIYKFDKDDLLLCLDFSRSERPAEFATKDKGAFALFRLKKEK